MCRTFLQALSTVTIAQIQQVGKKYFEGLFDGGVASCGICCNTSKVEEIKDGLTRYVSVSVCVHMPVTICVCVYVQCVYECECVCESVCVCV